MKYVTVEGDRWDWVSYLNYGEPYLYDEIIRANGDLAEELKLSPVLPGNITLEIPALEVRDIGELPPWRRE